MRLIVVPHKSTSREAHLWVGAFETAARPPDVTVSAGGASTVFAAWEPITAGGHLVPALRTAWRQEAVLTGLDPGRRYEIAAECGTEIARCHTTTLPDAMPAEGDQPFVVLLGSCFASYRDSTGFAGSNVARLPEPYRPDVKLLTGDQVYLDNPASEVLPYDRAGLAARFFDKYAQTWTQGDVRSGFSAILGAGATYFLADDHEFWNNHPNWSPLAFFRGRGSRDDWAEVARGLYAEFQALPRQALAGAQRFTVPPVEFYLIDTRFGRDAGNDDFMEPGELQQATAWIQAGHEPGVLVLTAPVFTERAGWFSAKFADRSLANYRQYAAFADALLRSQRPLLVLAGDVHFGRVALARRHVGGDLVEIVASPLALVHDSVGGDFKDAPSRFPAESTGAPRLDVATEQWQDWQGGDEGLVSDHFLTLGFTATDDAVRVRVTAWEINDGSPHVPTIRGRYDLALLRRPR